MEKFIDQIQKHLESFPRRVEGFGENQRHFQRFIATAQSLIIRVVGKGHTYDLQAQSVLDDSRNTTADQKAYPIRGILEGLLGELKSGALDSLKELAHAEVIGEIIDQSMELNEKEYKDAAAVLVGGVLEAHLRELCIKNGVDLEFEKDDGEKVKKKTARLNDDLKKQEVYGDTDQKQVTTWLAIRNNAAHAKYDLYTKDQVGLMIQGVLDFMGRNPA